MFVLSSFIHGACDLCLVPWDQLCCQMVVVAGGPVHHRGELHSLIQEGTCSPRALFTGRFTRNCPVANNKEMAR